MEQNCTVCDASCWLIYGFLYSITSISVDDLNNRKVTIKLELHKCKEDEGD